MYVCVCNEITDDEVEQCITAGCGTIDSLQQCVGIARNCGKCRAYIEDMLEQHKGEIDVSH